MQEIKKKWTVWKDKSKQLSRWLLPVAVCFLELLFHFWVGGSISVAAFTRNSMTILSEGFNSSNATPRANATAVIRGIIKNC